jgi:hypothetical protein
MSAIGITGATGITSTGTLLGQPATWTASGYATPTQPQWQFTLVKNQNGFILHFGDKSWICKDMEEVQQNFMVAMVEQRIEK